MTLDDVIAGILQREGSRYTNDPADAGGPTKWGITLRAYQDFKPSATEADLQGLDQDGAYAFYRWRLGPFVHIAVSDRIWATLLDAVTLHGPTGAVRLVQQVVGATIDGHLGPSTQAMLQAMPEARFLYRFTRARLLALAHDVQAHPEKLTFLPGWMTRPIDVAFGDL